MAIVAQIPTTSQASRCILIGKRALVAGTVYTLTVTSATAAELTATTPTGTPTWTCQYVGPRAQVLALCRWAQVTGLVGGH